ncbi:DUF6795 domain-containing protein [Bowmanella yangjiangensis]|uniref:DUF6795 domain-containing protein n=1 Tax=Bowmanella yangjiangensis TaxID=2811230 RepID=A0ABS3CWZ0_9ALTE|nr:DUF6795 domain-containing protein [Bowmanella yangjiangensis]MBN7821647.1 hypothetical protein [Bowmanella yangjiangensis]
MEIITEIKIFLGFMHDALGLVLETSFPYLLTFIALAFIIIGFVCLCSKIEGTVLFDNKPLKNITVTRKVDWNISKKTYIDSTKTDENGKFKFGTIYRFLPIPLNGLLHPLIGQEINIGFNQKDYCVWRHTKSNYYKGRETGKNQIKMEIDLGIKNKYQGENRYGESYYGIGKLVK